MNEESADVKIKKNRRRIFDAESFVQYNQGQVFVGRSVIEENRAPALKSFASDARGNRELLLRTVDDVLRNREVMVEQLSPATPEEERFQNSMKNRVKIEELEKQASGTGIVQQPGDRAGASCHGSQSFLYKGKI